MDRDCSSSLLPLRVRINICISWKLLTCAPVTAVPDSGAILCSIAGKYSELLIVEWVSARKAVLF